MLKEEMRGGGEEEAQRSGGAEAPGRRWYYLVMGDTTVTLPCAPCPGAPPLALFTDLPATILTRAGNNKVSAWIMFRPNKTQFKNLPKKPQKVAAGSILDPITPVHWMWRWKSWQLMGK